MKFLKTGLKITSTNVNNRKNNSSIPNADLNLESSITSINLIKIRITHYIVNHDVTLIFIKLLQ